MPTDVRTSELVINKLSKQQYENIQNPSDTELYLVPEDEEHKPICYPTTASEVTTTSMLVKSSVSDNGKILTENGFVYNTSGNPTVSDTKVICDLGAGFFEKKLENLTMNTEYHIKSYGQNSSGLVYGSELVQRTSSNPIPVEYQLVEYLESSGTQRILTNYVMSGDNIYLYVKALKKNITSSWENITFTQSSNNIRLASISFNNTNNYSTISTITSENGISFGIIDEFQIYEWELFIDTISKILYGKRNNGLTYMKYYSSDYYTGLRVPLFCKNTNDTFSEYFKGRIFKFKITTDDIDRLNMYPVYRIADNKPGMYDIVNNVFYTNQGTGEFTVGPDKEWDE